MASIVVNGSLCLAAGAIWPPVCLVIIGLRFYSRRLGDLPYRADDWLVIPTFIALCGMCAVLLWGAAEKAAGYPVNTIASSQRIDGSTEQELIVRKVSLAFFAVELLSIVALCCIKLSFMFFFRRIFCLRSASRLLRVASWSLILYIIVWAVVFFFLLLFECKTAFSKLWTSVGTLDQCLPNQPLEEAFVVCDVVGDLAIIIFPIPLIWRLHMSSKRKWAVTGVFLLGALSLMASITRMAIYFELLPAEFSAHPPDEDLISTAGIYFMILQVGFAILAACSACLYSLLLSTSVQRMLQSWASAFSLQDRQSERDSDVSNEHIASRPKRDQSISDAEETPSSSKN